MWVKCGETKIENNKYKKVFEKLVFVKENVIVITSFSKCKDDNARLRTVFRIPIP